MITRCHMRDLPINENRPRMLGGAVSEWWQTWQKTSTDCTRRMITHPFLTNPASDTLGGVLHSFIEMVNYTLTLFLALFVLQEGSFTFWWADKLICHWFSWLLLSGIAGNGNSVCVCVHICFLVFMELGAEAEISFIYMQLTWCTAQLAHPFLCYWMWLALWCTWTRWFVGMNCVRTFDKSSISHTKYCFRVDVVLGWRWQLG